MKGLDLPGTPAMHLVALLRDVGHARTMVLADWDGTIRLARRARLLGRVAHQLRGSDEGCWDDLPPQVSRHLRSAINLASHRRQMVRMELDAIAAVLPDDLPVVLLKGAAYMAQSIALADGRLPNDVDLLVRWDRLSEAEALLVAAGWEFEVTDEYDQRYYREYSHELPPMRAPGHALQVDLHHTIAPVTSRVRPDAELLFRDVVQLPDTHYFVLDPRDQVIHAAVHLFQDSELHETFRDLVDIDGLLRHHIRADADWVRLGDRTELHGASGMLWYAAHYCRAWLGTPVPDGFIPRQPGPIARASLDWILRRICLPHMPDSDEDMGRRVARTLGRIRYHRLRMPPGLLLRHGWHKLASKSPTTGLIHEGRKKETDEFPGGNGDSPVNRN